MTRGKAGFTGNSILGESGEKRRIGSRSAQTPPAQPPIQPKCPECTSQKVWKDGVRSTRDGDIQRWLCRACGYRFSQPNVKVNISSQIGERLESGKNYLNSRVGSINFMVKKAFNNSPLSLCEDVASHKSSSVSTVEKHLNSLPFYNRKRQVCASEGEAKNLATSETRIQEKAAGATTRTLDEATIKGKLVEFAFFLKKQGYKLSTIRKSSECIQNLVHHGANIDLFNPEKIKEIIAEQSNWGDGYKANITIAYTHFLRMHGMTWDPPKYTIPNNLPWIPLEQELDTLIKSTGKKTSIFLQGLKETGADPGELQAIEWIDVNPQARTITLNKPVKGHRPRIIEVSKELIERLNLLPRKSERVFQGKVHSLQKNFLNQRKIAVRKFSNPRLLKIVFTTFRHWKATMEYHKTKDILWVMKLLGHKTLKSTLVYIDLEKAIFKETNDEFTVKVAETLDEACKLLEVGFEYITDMEGKKIFRKRK